MPIIKVKQDGVWVDVNGAFVHAHTHTTNDIVNFPQSMPANGGDADTLDGKHASEFATHEYVRGILTSMETSGINPAVAELLVTILKNATYISDQSENIAALEAALAAGDHDTVVETVEYMLTPKFGGTTYPDKNTYVTTPANMSSGSAATVYAQTVLFEAEPVLGGTLHVTLDTTKLSRCRARIYLVDVNGNPAKHNKQLGDNGTGVSGDITNDVVWQDAATATTVNIIYMAGDITCKIPDGCMVKYVYVDFRHADDIVDEELGASGKLYDLVDAICFDGEVVAAKIVKEM